MLSLSIEGRKRDLDREKLPNGYVCVKKGKIIEYFQRSLTKSFGKYKKEVQRKKIKRETQ